MNFLCVPIIITKIHFRIFGLLALALFNCAVAENNTVHRMLRPPPVWNETWTDRLKRDLFMKYDKFARPAHHLNTTVVDFNMHITEVSVDDLKSSITVQAWVYMSWKDEKLKWNASNYGGLDQLHVGNHEVWQPDIILYNSVAGASIEHYGDTHCIISPRGTVYWAPPTTFHARCDLDLRLWPFDTQICYLQLGSWMYRGDEIDLQLTTNFGLQNVLTKFAQWDLVSLWRNRTLAAVKKYNYISVFYNMTIKRNSPMYYATVVTPGATIVFLILVIFWLPPQSNEKIILCGITALITSMHLIYFASTLPPLSKKPPLLICFYSGCLHIVTISLIISTFVINVARHPHCRSLPRGIKKLLVGKLGRYLVLFDHIQKIDSQRPSGEQESRENQNNDENIYQRSNLQSNSSESGERENIISQTTSTAQLEWVLAATALDRMFFFLFSIIFAIMAMVCLT